MEIDLKLISNILIGLFLYNMILKSIAATILKYILNSKNLDKERQTFKDKLNEKLNQQ